MNPRRLANQSGQILLLSVFLGLLLVLMIPLLSYLNLSNVQGGVQSRQQYSGQSSTQEGVAYALQALAASTATWNNAPNGTFPSGFDGATVFTGSSGSQFTLLGSIGPPAQSYEVAVVATAMGPGTHGAQVALQSVQALISRQTLAAVAPSDVNVAVALELGQPPVATNANPLTVQWGPIVVNSTFSWTLNNPLNNGKYPRKYSGGPIAPRDPSGAISPATTDLMEFWAFQALALPPLINLSYYSGIADQQTSPLTPNAGTATADGTCINPLNCSNWDANVTAIFSNQTATDPGGVLYVTGNTEFDDLGLDLSTGAIIVVGNLTLNSNDPGSGLPTTLNLRVPNTASLEYPYNVGSAPCTAAVQAGGGSCTDAVAGFGPVNFRGFLYVTGNLYVNVPGWVIDGAVRVDGQLIVNSGSGGSLTVAYDDNVNHQIQPQILQLMVDSQNVTPTP